MLRDELEQLHRRLADVVTDVEDDLRVGVRQRHSDACRIGVPPDVGERLLDDAQHDGLDLRGDTLGGSCHDQPGGNTGLGGPRVRPRPDRVDEVEVLERSGAQGLDGTARLVERRAGELGGALAVRGGDRLVEGLVSGLELGDDPGEALRDGVVDLGGQPFALLVDPRLAGACREGLLQLGVLLQGRLEPCVRPLELGDGVHPFLRDDLLLFAKLLGV